MSDKANIVASVLARLRNSSKSSGAPFQQVLQQYAIERFLYRLSKSQHAQGIDFGVGDVMVPGPRKIDYPTFLAGDTIPLLAYPVELAIAEKLQAMVALGDSNSRMKDFYDVWMCSQHLDFASDVLRGAISATFNNRETSVLAADFEALTANFVAQHQVQWNAFGKKIGEDTLVDQLAVIVQDIKNFAMPVFRSPARREKFAQRWTPGNEWRSSGN